MKNLRTGTLMFVCFLFAVFQSGTAKGQVLLSENFEGGAFPPAGWTLINGTSGSNWSQNTNPANSVSGSNSIQVLQGTSSASAWIITPGLNLQAGSSYRISYWCKSSGGNPKRLKLSSGMGPTLNDQVTLINNSQVTNTSFTERQVIYVAPTTGIYYFGFNGTFIWNATAGNLYTDSIVVQREITPDCSGTPTVGTASASPYYCTGVPVNVTLSGDYSANGISLQWYSSPAGVNTFSPIPGGTGLVLSNIQSAPTDYRCEVTCSFSGLSALSNIVSVATPSICYCVPSASNCALIDHISNVVFSGISNLTSCSQPIGFTDYSLSLAPATITAGDVVPITVSVGGGGAEYVTVWIDYNQNGTFDASEYSFLGSATGTAINTTITIPITAMGGSTRMRVRVQKGSAIAAGDACAGVQFGETEDYAVNITALLPCSGTPNGGTTNSTATAVCPGVNFTLNVTGASNNTGLLYQWESSVDNITWSGIPGASTASYTLQQTAARYYRRQTICSNSGLTAPSVSILVNMQICYCTPLVVNCTTYGIDSVGFGSIGNSSGCSPNSYGNYTTTVAPATVTAGTYQQLWVKVNTSSTPKYTAAWIDFNHDGIFSAVEFFDLTGTGVPYNSKQIRIPFNALTGLTTMRIQSSVVSILSAGGGCSGFTSGETEDYRINILPNTSGANAFSFFVNANAAFGGNGLSWTSAFTTLTEALANASKKDTIRVAKGTFRAQYSLKDSVILLGGYPDTGTPADADRNWGTNLTILSADAGNPTLYSDNRSNVLDGSGLSANTIVDGFIIEGAYRINGSTGGAGMNLTNASLQVNNCVFRNNFSYNYHPSGTGGSAVTCTGGSPVFNRCFFVNNNDAAYGVVQLKQNASAMFINCVFSGNISHNTVYSNQSTVNIKHCTFFNNQSKVNGTNDTLRLSTLLADNASAINIANSIFFNNVNTGGSFNESSADTTDFVLRGSSVINVIKTITQAYNTGEPTFLSANPKFRDTSSLAGPDGFYFTTDDGLQLANPCSPAINSGDNAASAAIAIDLTGNPRLFGTTVDLGAYEVQSPVTSIPSVVYVHTTATGANDGSSWANAFTDLQAALQHCADTIKVAAGNYTASVSNIKSSFWLENGRVILGGYPNTGNPGDNDRNPTLYLSVLTANLPVGGNVKSEIIVRGKNLDSTSVLDGFVISDVNEVYTRSAAMVLTLNASPHIRNIVFKNNLSGLYSAALITTTSSKPLFYNCKFENNGGFTSSGSHLGAVYNTGGSAPVFRKCLFSNNSTRIENVSPYYGGAITNNNANPVIDSCTFIKNTANNWGGAIANFNSSPIITNTNFYGNYASTAGGDIYNDASSPQVINCIFADSTMSEYGGSIYNTNLSSPLFTNCQFRNSKAAYYGGVVYNNNSSPVFNRCVITGASTLYGRGIIYNKNYSAPMFINCAITNNLRTGPYSIMHSEKSMPSVVNSTIVNNYPSGLLINDRSGLITNTDSTTLTIRNTILWGNAIKGGINIPDGDIVDPIGTTTASIIQNCFTRSTGVNGVNGNFVGIDPKLVDITNPEGPDGQFYTADDGIVLCNCSPAVNNGSNSAVTGYQSDFLNNPRIVNGSVDIGAVELQSNSIGTSRAYYVNATASGLNDGSSWVNAYTSLQQAVQNSCADTIRVAKGIYKPAITNRDSSFYVNRKLVLWGGYPDNGNPPDSLRSPWLHQTILSGDIGITGDSTDNSYVIMRVKNDDTTVVVDGFTFTRANGIMGQYNSNRGGGINSCYNKNLLIRNCLFFRNDSQIGGALYTSGKITVEGCVFQQNKSTGLGGAYYLESADAIIKNSVFLENKSQNGGGVFCNTNAVFENVVFYKNKAEVAGGVFLNNNPAAQFTNCNFVSNDVNGSFVGIGLYNYGSSFFNPARPVLRNCIFYENTFNGTMPTSIYSDWVCLNGSNGTYLGPLDIKYSAVFTGVPNITSNIPWNKVYFRDVNNPLGPDGIWFTADDGLQADRCSWTINNGNNSDVAGFAGDITGSPRIRNVVVDMGAYEYQATTPENLLTNANDSLVANIQRTDNNGWTHYYDGCRFLLSIKKGNQSFGNVGDGAFRLVVKTTPAYGSGAGTNLSSAAYVSSGINWHIMNRYWTITPTAQITDSVLVRFPFSHTDFNDVRGSNPALINLQQLIFYTNDTPYAPLSLSVPMSKFRPTFNAITASTTQWTYSAADTINYAEFYVKTLSGGGGGSGNGLNGGPFLRISAGCNSSTRTIVSPETGNSYQWQVSTGSGYADISDDAIFSGTNTESLTITTPPSSWSGRTFRCVVNGIPSANYYILVFQNTWTGAADNAWENPLNWSCGDVPDNFTDVIINSGTVIINSAVSIKSLRLSTGVNLTVSQGNNLTVLH